MTEEYNKRNTDEAWERLQTRLEQDGLLAEEKAVKKNLWDSSGLKWAVGIAILCISGVIASMFINNKVSDGKLLSLHNKENAVTLVKTLEDGSVVYLAEQASLSFPEYFEKNKRQVFLKGNALFDVSGNKKRPFIIETEQAKIEVLGTKFNVKNRDENTFSLSVERGEVKVTLKENGQSILIKEGETGFLQSGELKTALTRDIDQFGRYMKQIQFKDERLADIIRVINGNAQDVELDIAPPLEDRRLTVTFANDSPYAMAQLICMALNLQCVQQQNRIYISEIK